MAVQSLRLSYTIPPTMIASRRGRIFFAALILSVPVAHAQVEFDLVLPQVVQQRLDLYKGNDNVREIALLKLFADAGCSSANLSEQPVPHRKQPNIVCVLPGTTTDTIVVGAHFDHVDEGDGIVDNWSGASLLPSLFQSIASTARKHTFVFVAFTGEEAGLIGSRFYVQHLSKDQLLKTKAMINLDTLGLGPPKIWVSQSDPSLVHGIALVARAMNIQLSGMDVDDYGDSDEESFIRKKICTMTVHSLTPQTTHVLHTRSDNPSAIRFQDYYDSYRLLAEYLAGLDSTTHLGDHVCEAEPID